jgi:hypothetical protein
VLFVDLVGFTTLVEDLDAEDVALLQEHYFTQVAGLVAAAGVQVEKYTPLLPTLVDTAALELSFVAALDDASTAARWRSPSPRRAAYPRTSRRASKGVETVEVVVPGTRCPSVGFLTAALERAGTTSLATTRPYATCATTGRRGPVLDRVADVQRTFGRMRPGAVVLAHRSEWRARRRQVPVHDAG